MPQCLMGHHFNTRPQGDLVLPAGVGLMTSIGIIKSTWWQLLIVCISTTMIIIAVTGIVVQAISRRTKEKNV